jgi:hypothetical protein
MRGSGAIETKQQSMFRRRASMRIGAALFVFILLTTPAMPAVDTVTGEVLDVFCYATRDARGKEHSQCASSCIKAGIPVAVLTDEGVMYFPLRQDHKPANPLFENLGGEKVKVTGSIYEKNSTKFIVVNSVEKVK